MPRMPHRFHDREVSAGAKERAPTRWAVGLLLASGLFLSACGGPATLSLATSEKLPSVIQAKPRSAAWCTGLQKTADSLRGLGRGESYGVAARIVRNDHRRLASALRGLPRHSATAAALQDAARTAALAVSELATAHNAGMTDANRAASQITTALTGPHPAGTSC